MNTENSEVFGRQPTHRITLYLEVISSQSETKPLAQSSDKQSNFIKGQHNPRGHVTFGAAQPWQEDGSPACWANLRPNVATKPLWSMTYALSC